jgi:hypothetical protein
MPTLKPLQKTVRRSTSGSIGSTGIAEAPKINRVSNRSWNGRERLGQSLDLPRIRGILLNSIRKIYE